jgi:hypothetical protein
MGSSARGRDPGWPISASSKRLGAGGDANPTVAVAGALPVTSTRFGISLP